MFSLSAQLQLVKPKSTSEECGHKTLSEGADLLRPVFFANEGFWFASELIRCIERTGQVQTKKAQTENKEARPRIKRDCKDGEDSRSEAAAIAGLRLKNDSPALPMLSQCRPML